MSKGVVLNLGDLKWVGEYRTCSTSEQGWSSYLCPMEQMIMELGKLVFGIGDQNNGKFWLMGIATFQTYMKCKSGHPSLESIWGLHPITIPAGSLRLSLITDSYDLQSQTTSNKAYQNGSSCWIILEGDEEKQLTCCADCAAKFETEARSLQASTCNSESTSSSLPAWLQQYKNESKGLNNSNDQESIPIKDLCEKWNSICSSIHHQPYSSEKTITFSSLSPSSSTSGFSYDQYPNLHLIHHDWPMIEPKQSWRDYNFWVGSETVNKGNAAIEPSLRMYIPEHRDHPKPSFSSNPNSTPNSTSSSDVMEVEYPHKFKELNAENLKTLCNAMEKKVPWQKDIIPEIASTILKCSFSSTRADSTEDCRNKRSREEQSCSYIERFAEALSSNPHRVFFVEDVEQADYCSQMGFKRAIERGRITNANGEEVSLSDAIIILSCESFSSRSRACSPPIKQKTDNSQEQEQGPSSATMEETSPCVSLDLNICINDDSAEDQSIDNIGLLESVDSRIIFKIQEL
ncbi:hypothetical protein GH714_037723 [Hevea brasiliensis]|uniref:SMAX1-like nucleotide binding domain-containing protein n=1 Tax=Hevea brasiliensis TaxID=3981 RepID=A0A6A6KNQ1_HEVBR|nr:hypothetical protein GH714_037723 [Hevea brasiliensis]